MPAALSIVEELAFCTVRIGCELPDGRTSVGTGFFVSFMTKDDGRSIPVIVTNHHVVKGALTGTFLLTKASASGEAEMGTLETFKLASFESLWIGHPDADVDLCIMPLGPLLNEAHTKGTKFFYKAFIEETIASPSLTSELTALEEITMIGYPVGIWDSKNNMPIFRKGVTATHPYHDYLGRKEFVVDIACFPGSSGSPVLLCNLGGYTDRHGNTRLGTTRLALLGILYAGPQYTAEGEIKVVPIPTDMKPVPVTHMPTNLGYVIKAERLKEFEPILRRLAGES
jgi:hypothetical protein